MTTTKAKNYTFKLDDLTATRLEWLLHFTELIGVPKSHKRILVTRAIEFYTEYMEEFVLLYHMKPKHKDILQERTAILKAMTDKDSFWKSPKIPEDCLTSNGVFRDYSDISTKRVIPKLPKVQLRHQGFRSKNHNH